MFILAEARFDASFKKMKILYVSLRVRLRVINSQNWSETAKNTENRTENKNKVSKLPWFLHLSRWKIRD